MQASAEVRENRSTAAMAAWSNRPGDLVYDSIEQLVEHTKEVKNNSFIREAVVEHLEVFTPGDSLREGEDSLFIRHKKEGGDTIARFNNHSFNQFCSTVGARAGEYRKLPAAIAQIPLMWMTGNSERKDVKVLVGGESDSSEPLVCRAINSPSYGRIWNHELASAVQDHIDPEIWVTPKDSAFHTKTGFITTNDRKAFIFLVNEGNPITLEGSDSPLYRGFYAWNSEVGDGTCGIAEFLFNKACANRAIMNLTGFSELNIRHTSGAPDRWVRDAVPSLNEYVNKGTDQVVALLEASKKKKVAKDEKGAMAWLKDRGFTSALSKAALESAREEERGADPNASPLSVWNIIQGITAEARTKANNDERVAIEASAGKLMKAVM